MLGLSATETLNRHYLQCESINNHFMNGNMELGLY